MKKLKILNQISDNIWENETLWICSETKNKNKFGICDNSRNLILPAIFNKITMNNNYQITGYIDNNQMNFEIRFINNIAKVEFIKTLYVDKKGRIS